MTEYAELGIDTFIFSGYPHLEEAHRTAELLFPKLPLDHDDPPPPGFHLTVTGELPLHLWESFQRALAGLVLGGIIGFVFGLLNGLFGPANRLFDSSLQMLRNVPHLAMIPLVILWFGIGEPAKLFLIVIGVFFPIYVHQCPPSRS